MTLKAQDATGQWHNFEHVDIVDFLETDPTYFMVETTDHRLIVRTLEAIEQ